MKHFALTMAGVLLLFSISCSKNDNLNPTPQKPADGNTVTIRVNMDDLTSKVIFTEEHSILKFSWEDKDQLRVVSGENAAVYSTLRILSPRVAEFTGIEVEGECFDILYPGTYESIAAAEADTSSPTQDGNGNTSHLRFKALLEGVDDYRNISFYQDWAQNHGGALKISAAVKVIATLPDGVTTIKKFSIKIGDKTYSLNLENVDVSSSGQTLVAYMMLPWENVSIPDGTQVRFTVTATDNNEYGLSYPVEGDRTIMMGKLNVFGSVADIPGGDDEEDDDFVRIAGALPVFTHTGVFNEVFDRLDVYGDLPEDVINVAAENSRAAGLNSMETANCYVINEAGRFAFPVDVRGNGVSVAGLDVQNVGVESASEVWDEGDILESVNLYRDTNGLPWVIVETPSVFTAGNALVSVTDNEGNILWSWHIWSTSYRIAQDDQTIGHKSFGCWAYMPLELGMKTLDDTGCMLYQWGRKDPFPCTTPSSTTNSQLTVEEYVSQPDRFYTQNVSMYCNNGGASLWNTELSADRTGKTMLDPCPPGYFVMPYNASKLMLRYGVESCEGSKVVSLKTGLEMRWHPILYSAAVNNDYHFYWQHSYWQSDDVAGVGKKGSSFINKSGTAWSADNAGGNGFGFPVRAVRQGRYKAGFMGDSITAIWGGSKENEDVDNDRKGDSRFFVTNAFLNKGVSGETTSQMLARFDMDIVANNPERVVILAGTNDLAGNDNGGKSRSIEHIMGNLKAMADKAFNGGASQVYLCSVLPAKQFRWNTNVKPMPLIQELNASIKAYCDVTPGCTYVDYYSAWINEEVTGAKAGLTYDEVHPTVAGCTVLENVILSHLR